MQFNRKDFKGNYGALIMKEPVPEENPLVEDIKARAVGIFKKKLAIGEEIKYSDIQPLGYFVDVRERSGTYSVYFANINEKENPKIIGTYYESHASRIGNICVNPVEKFGEFLFRLITF
jgi:hypothetical protein